VDVENYISYLHTTISEKTGKPMSYNNQRNCLDRFKTVIRWCQLHRPDDVPITEIFTGNEYTGVNRKLKIDFIPDDVVAQINEALKTEENPYLKYGIIILQSTGMRIGDLLKLRIDCIKPHLISGYTIEWVQHKGRKNKAPMPVRSECVAAIEKLVEITKDLRDEADEKDKNTLMIRRVPVGKGAGKVMNLNSVSFNNWFKKFIKDNDIKDANGDYYNLTSHQFRRTLGTDMLSKGTNINVIQQVLGHTDASVTKRFYADVKDKERAEVFKSVGVIGNINQIQSNAFDNVSEFEWFKANKDKCVAGLCDGYCTKPVTDGNICPRLLKRQKCYTCSRYITTPEYLD
ncbi:phage integrase family protein, partial [Anaerostipes hadrus]|uniref:tyrosine-type recombinase/integrase n=7 Tax=Lachnospiraceae TaxID=186803 RepID=UPI00156F12E2